MGLLQTSETPQITAKQLQRSLVAFSVTHSGKGVERRDALVLRLPGRDPHPSKAEYIGAPILRGFGHVAFQFALQSQGSR